MPRSLDLRPATLLTSVVVIALIGAGFMLALETAGSPQCCDASAYAAAAHSFLDGEPSLNPAHNYGYPAFLALLDLIGLDTPRRIAFAQTSLLYLTVLITAYVIARCTSSAFAVAVAWLAAVTLVPAAAWGGLIFSESLAVPMLLLVLAFGIATVFHLLRDAPTWGLAVGLAVGLGLTSGFVWMVRPGLIWIPIGVGLGVLALSAGLLWRRERLGLLVPVAFAVSAMLTVVPQLQLGDPLKLELAELQRDAGPQVFRYATDLRSEAPAGMIFSPLPVGSGADPTVAERTSGSRSWRLTAMAAHVVTGWDARPSPNYVYKRTGNRWIVATAFSGFLIAGALAAAWLVWERRRRWLEPETAAPAALVVMFAASQGVMSMTSAEFRFNIVGWLVAACCLAMLSALGWWTRRRAAAYIALALGFSAAVLLVGHMTLLYSERWLEYVNLLG